MIETRLLVYFLAVAREQNITRAAESLHITQPTLSKQMQDLERQVGHQLLVRGKRKVELTEEGRYLRARAAEVVELVEQTESTLKGDAGIDGGDVYLACAETAAMRGIADAFRVVLDEHPRIRLHVHSCDADGAYDRLEKGLADAGLLMGPRRNERFDYREMAHRDRFGILMSSSCGLANRERVSAADLAGLPLIFPQQAHEGDRDIEWGGIDPSRLNVVATYNLVTNAAFFVERGLGYAFCVDGLVRAGGEHDLAFRPIEPDVTVGTCLVTKRFKTLSPAARLFLRAVEGSGAVLRQR